MRQIDAERIHADLKERRAKAEEERAREQPNPEPDCGHRPKDYFSWYAMNPISGKADILIVVCRKCGAVVKDGFDPEKPLAHFEEKK